LITYSRTILSSWEIGYFDYLYSITETHLTQEKSDYQYMLTQSAEIREIDPTREQYPLGGLCRINSHIDLTDAPLFKHRQRIDYPQDTSKNDSKSEAATRLLVEEILSLEREG